MQADSSDAEPTSTSTSDEAGSQTADRPSQRIRIGTQRLSPWAKALRRGEKPPVTESGAESPTEVEQVIEAPPAELAPAPTPAAVAEELKPKPFHTGGPPKEPRPSKQEPKHYPPPNIRDQLSPELEAEYQAALGDLSLDSLMNKARPTCVPELAPESRVTGRVAKIHRDDVFVDLGGRNRASCRCGNSKTAAGRRRRARTARRALRCRRRPLRAFAAEPRPSTSAIGTTCSEGQIIEVTVTGSNKGGLECQVAGIRGFIPMGQVSIYRVENPEEFVGQRLACVVTEANRDRRNLVLSHRAVMERERNEQREKLLTELAPGQLREGIVRSLKDFGAFVDLGGVDGLIHISQLSWDRVKHPSEVLEVGQKVKVRIEKFDKDTGKVSLSYREVGDEPVAECGVEVSGRRDGPRAPFRD